MSERAKRFLYFGLFLLCALIALYIDRNVYDRFARSYLGSVLEVGMIYSLARIFLPSMRDKTLAVLFALAVTARLLRGFHWLDLLGYGAGILIVFVSERVFHDARRLESRRRTGHILSSLFLLLMGIGQIAGALYSGVLLYGMVAAGVTADFLGRYWYVYGGNLINALGIAVCGAICAIYHAREDRADAIIFAGSIGVLAYALPAVGRFFFDGRWGVYGMYLPVPIAALLWGVYRRRSGRSKVAPQRQADEMGQSCAP